MKIQMNLLKMKILIKKINKVNKIVLTKKKIKNKQKNKLN